MSVIRLNAKESERLIDLADKILGSWRGYTDEAAMILAETDGEPHNTITPIARRRGEDFELDLVLRNNLTTPDHPLGIYHPHEEFHHIKKENIGLIEVMGLAILPGRLKKELEAVEEKLLSGEDMTEDPLTKSHAKWAGRYCSELRNYSRKCKRNRSERDWNCLFKSSGTGRSLQTDTRRKRSIFKIYKSSIK